MLSEEAQAGWRALVEASAGASLDRDLLHAFLIGLHRSGEELYAHDLKVLLDEAGLAAAVQEEVIGFVEPALALLDAYDRKLAEERADADEGWGWYDEEVTEIGPGDLVL